MKKSFALDSRLFLFVLCLLFAGLMTVISLQDGEKGFSLFCGMLTLMFVFGVITAPKLYIADEEGFSIYYLPFVKEYFKWNDIKRIKIKKSNSRSIIFDFLWREYEIVPTKEKRYKGSKYHSIFHSSEISRTFLTKRIIEKYWEGTIEDNSLSWFKKRFSNKESGKIKYELTEVKEKEKWARESLNRIAQQYESKASLSGKTIDTSCTYFVDGEDFKSRPKENYSYAAGVFVEKENDEERSFYIKQEILFVSYGKKQIKIIENNGAFDEISKLINEAIER
ncbi:MAG: hypothetical protein IKJ27_09745 [Clostridia bacterium]|nr:hypothetical protein [Clostridia bacterium]